MLPGPAGSTSIGWLGLAFAVVLFPPLPGGDQVGPGLWGGQEAQHALYALTTDRGPQHRATNSLHAGLLTAVTGIFTGTGGPAICPAGRLRFAAQALPMHNCSAATYPFTATPYEGLAGLACCEAWQPLRLTFGPSPRSCDGELLHTLPCARLAAVCAWHACLCCSWGPRQPTCKPLLRRLTSGLVCATESRKHLPACGLHVSCRNTSQHAFCDTGFNPVACRSIISARCP